MRKSSPEFLSIVHDSNVKVMQSRDEIFIRLYTALSSYFTGGQIPNINFGIFILKWVDWWVVILGLSFVITTLY